MVFVTGFANAGTANAVAASRAMARTNEFIFMRVNFLSIGIDQPHRRLALARRS
jgi:hypothetical protein